LTALGVWLFVEAARELPKDVEYLRQTRQANEQIEFFHKFSFVECVPVLLSAWGVLAWRRWGHALTLVFCGFMVFFQVAQLSFLERPYFELRWVATSLTAALIFAWLLLPQVRKRFYA
jgi:hypothetical protein